MKVYRIQIDQQMAKIHIDSQMAALSIKTGQRMMQVEQQRAQMSLQRQAPKVDLDMEAFQANIGLESVMDATKASAARAQVQVAQSIKKFAQQEDAIATLPSAGNAIAQTAKSNMLEDRTPERRRSEVPSSAVKMTGDPGELQIDWTKQEIRINWDKYQIPEISVEPKASVEIQLGQEPQVSCQVVELTIPKETGREVDSKA